MGEGEESWAREGPRQRNWLEKGRGTETGRGRGPAVGKVLIPGGMGMWRRLPGAEKSKLGTGLATDLTRRSRGIEHPR